MGDILSLGLRLKRIQKKKRVNHNKSKKITDENPMVARQRKRLAVTQEFKKLKNIIIEQITQKKEPLPFVLTTQDIPTEPFLNSAAHVDNSVWAEFEKWCHREGLNPVFVVPSDENPLPSVFVEPTKYRPYLTFKNHILPDFS